MDCISLTEIECDISDKMSVYFCDPVCDRDKIRLNQFKKHVLDIYQKKLCWEIWNKNIIKKSIDWVSVEYKHDTTLWYVDRMWYCVDKSMYDMVSDMKYKENIYFWTYGWCCI